MPSKLTAAAVALAGLAAIAAPAFGQTPPPPPYDPHPVLSADLDLGGPGQFNAVDDTGTGQLCYMLVAPVQNPTGAFIGDGKTNQSVLALQPPVGGTSGACVNIGEDLARRRSWSTTPRTIRSTCRARCIPAATRPPRG